MHKLSDLGASTQTIPQHPRSVLNSIYSLLLLLSTARCNFVSLFPTVLGIYFLYFNSFLFQFSMGMVKNTRIISIFIEIDSLNLCVLFCRKDSTFEMGQALLDFNLLGKI